jgi:hypothetical protein
MAESSRSSWRRDSLPHFQTNQGTRLTNPPSSQPSTISGGQDDSLQSTPSTYAASQHSPAQASLDRNLRDVMGYLDAALSRPPSPLHTRSSWSAHRVGRNPLTVRHQRGSLSPISECISVGGEFSSTGDHAYQDVDTASEIHPHVSSHDEQAVFPKSSVDSMRMRRLIKEYEKMDKSAEDMTESTKQGATLLAPRRLWSREM